MYALDSGSCVWSRTYSNHRPTTYFFDTAGAMMPFREIAWPPLRHRGGFRDDTRLLSELHSRRKNVTVSSPCVLPLEDILSISNTQALHCRCPARARPRPSPGTFNQRPDEHRLIARKRRPYICPSIYIQRKIACARLQTHDTQGLLGPPFLLTQPSERVEEAGRAPAPADGR